MTIHYHGTPITPVETLLTLKGRSFCVSHAAQQDVVRVHEIGQSVLLDNGAFSAWTKGIKPDWASYYAWCDQWLDYRTTWAIIPDVIDGTEDDQAALILDWPHGHRGAPVWHLHEGIDRLCKLLDHWPKVCFGSSGEFAVVLSPPWIRRVDQAWNAIMKKHRRPPWVHMLRGMRLAKGQWPFASVDSSDVGRNHHRDGNDALGMAERWDAIQCHPGVRPGPFTRHLLAKPERVMRRRR